MIFLSHHLHINNGWICLNKPAGISSNLAMIKVRRLLGKKLGYVGTLDPFATGVLPLAIGEARKFIPYIENVEKTYIFTVVFGKTTDTLDKDGNITEISENIPSPEEIAANIIPHFLGEIEQIPPLFSAIKINGRRACDRARAGESLQLSTRKVTIHSLKIIDIPAQNKMTFEVKCSKGTYVRSLARDIAHRADSVAFVDSLQRVQSGFFSINHAIALEKLEEIRDTDELVNFMFSIESPLDDIPALYLKTDLATKLQHGLSVQSENNLYPSSKVKIVDDERKVFCGIGFMSGEGWVKPVRMCTMT
jgi:tRNA pseudouridine55 synthase